MPSDDNQASGSDIASVENFAFLEINHAALEIFGEGHCRLMVRNLHAYSIGSKSGVVNDFSDNFSDFFWAFTLDNPPGVKEKSVQKRKNFSTKKLDAPQPSIV
jgi:hypothetical protein